MAEPLFLSKDLRLPIEVAGQVIALVGIRNSGKTNSAGVIAEELLDRNQQVVFIDPTDGSWGLRSGYPIFIFGGPHGDIPLAETDGKAIAEFVVMERVPLILSLRHLRKAGQRRFVTEFCEEIYHLKGKPEHRSPLTVFIDEAPLFVPQRVMGETARVVGAVEDLCARGRNTGFGVVLVTQRPATINKDVLSQADTIIAHRLISPQDRKALGEWLEENASAAELKTILGSLAGMPKGQAWVWAPQLDIMRQVQIRKRRTFDSSASPSVGEVVRPPKHLHEVNLDSLKAKLAANVERAKAEDPKALRAELAAVKAELARVKAAPAPSVKPVKETRVEVPILKDSQIATLVRHYERMLAEADRHGKAMTLLWDHQAEEARALLAALQTIIGQPPKLATVTPIRPTATIPRPARVIAGPTDEAVGTGGLRRILVALAQRPEGLTLPQIGIRAGLSSRSGTFSTYMSRGRQRGWIQDGGPGAASTITDAGLQALGSYDPLPTGQALLDYWLRELGTSGAARILQALADAYPNGLTLEQLGERADLNSRSGTFSTYLSRLRTLQLIEGRGQVRASAELFA